MNLSAINKMIRAAAATFESDEDGTTQLLRIWESVQDGDGSTELHADVSHRIAATFRNNSEWALTEKFARLAIGYESELDRPAILGNHLMFLSQFLSGRDRHEEALTYAERALIEYRRAYQSPHREVAYMEKHVQALRAMVDSD